MKLADDVTDCPRRFLELRGRAEAQLRHRVDDASLHRLESVRDVRQRAIEDDVHRIVEVRLARERRDRSVLDVGRERWRGRLESELLFALTRGHTNAECRMQNAETRSFLILHSAF